jgi:hypothetical protein
MKNSIPIQSLFLAAGLLLSAGCTVERPVAVGPQVAPADGPYVGQPTQPPPANQKDVVPAPPGSLPQWWFIPGHWAWRGQWVWVPGHWRTRPHSGDVWLPGKWVQQTNSAQQTNVYVWQKGRWRSGAPADEESSDR